MKYFKNGYNKGDGKFLLEMEGRARNGGGRGVGFIIGRMENFKISLHS